MGSIPLLATQVAPVRDPLSEFSRVAALQSVLQQQQAQQQQMQQRAAMAPLEQQAQQQANVGAEQQNQQRAILLKDQTVLRDLSPSYITKDDQGKVAGYDFDGFIKAAQEKGVSPQTLIQMQQQRAEATKHFASADEATHKNEETKRTSLFNSLESVRAVKDPVQRQQTYMQTRMKAAKAGDDVSQWPLQVPDDAALSQFEAALGMHAQIQADAKEQAEIFKAGRPPVDQQELNAYLANPKLDAGIKKDAATFAAWKAKQSPMGVVLANQLGQPGQGSALDQAAERYSKSGELPAGFARSPGTITAILKRAADLHPNADVAANKVTLAADSAALKKVQTQFDTMNAFEGTALKNLDLFLQKAKAVPDLGVKFANVPLRKITGDMIGTQSQAALEAARQTAATEVAKVLSSATGAGVLSDSQKKEALDVINGNLPYPAMVQVVETLRQDIANRHQAYQNDIDAIRERIGAKPQGAAAAAGGARSGTKSAHQVGDIVVYQNKHYKVTGITPDGKLQLSAQ